MKRIILGALALFLVSPAFSQVGIALRAGTLGPGVDIGYAINSKLTVRGAGSYFTLSQSETLDEEVAVRVDGEVTIGAIGAVLDYHPFGNFFRLTGGLNLNLFKVSASGVPTEPYCFGNENGGVCDGKVFLPERLGSFGADVAYSSTIAPYLGMGFGKVAGRKRVGFLLDIGALYAGSPEIDLVATGLLAPTASADQEADLNRGIESFKWYPVVSMGLAIRL